MQCRHDRIHNWTAFSLTRHKFEQTTPQDLSHVITGNRLHWFCDALEHVFQCAQALCAGLVVGLNIGGDQRSHHDSPIHFGNGLVEYLIEIFDSPQHAGVLENRLAIVPYSLIHQNQSTEAILEWRPQQIDQQRLGRDGEIFIVGFQAHIAGIASQLVCQRAPQRADTAGCPIRPVNFQPFVDVHFVTGK